jgi:hypothetical protein
LPARLLGLLLVHGRHRIRLSAGVRQTGSSPDGFYSFLNAAEVGPSRVYATGDTELGGILVGWDTSQDPPAVAFSRKLTGTGYALATVGAHLAVGTTAALELLDVSSSGEPTQVATLSIPTTSLSVDGGRVYVGTLAGEFLVLDLTDPGAPLEVGRVPLPGLPHALQSAGPSLLLVAAERAGLLLVDVSNPASPSVRSSLDVGSPVFGVALSGSTAWIAARAGLATADVSDPDRPALIARAALVGKPFNPIYDPETGLSASIHQGIAYVGTGGSALLSASGAMVEGFDIRYPASPRLVSLQALKTCRTMRFAARAGGA